MPPVSLLENAWLPVRCSSSRALCIKPHELTADLASNSISDLDWPRADFRFASLEFLIGLLATACPPEDKAAWTAWWLHPPPPEVLEAAFAPLAAAFLLDGDGPRFCQDAEDFSGKSLPVERLLIDAPGENTVKRNTDLLVKRDRVAILGRPAAAMALYALQAFAPSGGAGHRTSLRGGGPLTTLVLPNNAPCTLWHMLWANVPDGLPARAGELPLVFPWLAPTRRSEGDIGTVLDAPSTRPASVLGHATTYQVRFPGGGAGRGLRPHWQAELGCRHRFPNSSLGGAIHQRGPLPSADPDLSHQAGRSTPSRASPAGRHRLSPLEPPGLGEREIQTRRGRRDICGAQTPAARRRVAGGPPAGGRL